MGYLTGRIRFTMSNLKIVDFQPKPVTQIPAENTAHLAGIASLMSRVGSKDAAGSAASFGTTFDVRGAVVN